MEYLYDKKDVINQYVKYDKITAQLEKLQVIIDNSNPGTASHFKKIYANYQRQADRCLIDYNQKLKSLSVQEKSEVTTYLDKQKDKNNTTKIA